MKKTILLFFLAFAGWGLAQAQSAKACCAGKDKTACTKEASAKAACCAKAGTAGCSKAAAGTATMPSAAEGVVAASFRVYGNCGMCKRTIEGALVGHPGVQSANWDMSAKMLTVEYDAEKVQVEDIKAKVAAVGYDSDTHRAPDEAYNSLHTCCQYERPRG